MSLFKKIFLSISILLLLFFSLFVNHMIKIEKEESLNSLIIKIENNKKFYTPVLSQSLFNFDKIALEVYLSSIYLDEEVHAINFIDFSSKINLEYNTKKTKNKDLIKSIIHLQVDDNKLGILHIFYTKDKIRNSTNTYITNILQISILFLVITFGIIFYSIKRFTKSINNLTHKVYLRTKELKTTSLLLEEKKKELETIIQEAPNPMMIHNEDGKVIMINKTWEILTGYDYKDIDTIEKWTYLAYGERMPIIKEYIDNLYELKQRSDEGQYDIITKNGNIINWQFSSAPLGVIDGKRTVISSAMDITELKNKDEMLINQSRHAAMGEMIGMIAHQWRQPIAVISMDANNILADIALEEFNTNKAEKYANSITYQTQHLSSTIDDFRNFFKPDKVLSEVNIRQIIDTTLSIVKDSLKNNSIELTTSFETDKGVKAYPRELMQVFVNIITNSKDALTSHKTDNPSIKVRVYEDEKYINTQICDNGGGIASDILPKVFDPYFSTKDEKSGTGLGLYMSKMIIEEHLNGTIEVINTNGGSCFTVRLLKK